MNSFFSSPPVQSFWFGMLSAASMPVGALVGIFFPHRKKINAVIMAFGAGSLICALTLELMGPAFERSGFSTPALGALVGGVLFVLINNFLNGQGAFLRKPATFMRHLLTHKKARLRALIEKLSHIPIICGLPAEEMRTLLPAMHSRDFEAGHILFEQGERGDSLYLIDQGEVEVLRDGRIIDTMETGAAFGEMALLSGEPRNATVRAKTPIRTWQLLKEDFDTLVKSSPQLLEALKQVGEKRLASPQDIAAWRKKVGGYLDALLLPVTDNDAREELAAHRSAGVAMAIWLGLLFDGIPESAIIGASIAQTAVSGTLIAGLFLSHFPEAMSSTVGLRRGGASIRHVLTLWFSQVIIAGRVALLGNLIFAGALQTPFAFFEGCAAGAMLVMIAETMLPEAYEQGGAVTGISTLLGFLSGLLVKSIF